MKLLPIKLGINRPLPNAKNSGAKRAGIRQGKTPEELLEEITPKILERDKNTCRFCGFQSEKYQKILIINYDEYDLRPANLATSCIFCHQCFHLNDVSPMRSGALIWCPELKQNQINQIAKAIYIGRISQGAMADASRKVFDTFMERREEVKSRLGSDDPYILSTVLRDFISDKSYSERNAKIEGVRLLPLDRRIIKDGELEFNQFPQILAYWRSKDGPFGPFPPAKWLAEFDDYFDH